MHTKGFAVSIFALTLNVALQVVLNERPNVFASNLELAIINHVCTRKV